MRVTTTKCDNCGIEKKESNNWYCIIINNYAVGIIKQIGKFEGEIKDACGEECATKLIWENMKK